MVDAIAQLDTRHLNPNADLTNHGATIYGMCINNLWVDGGSSANSSTSVAAAVSSKTATKKTETKEEKEKKKQAQIDWAKLQKIAHVSLTLDGQDVDTVGSVKWSVLSTITKRAFLKSNNIQVSHDLRLVDDCPE